MELQDKVDTDSYQIPFSADLIAHAPGRINIIGEHTDYNGGFVLPASIDKTITAWVRTLPESENCRLLALDTKETHSFSLKAMQPSAKGWPNYIMGIVYEMQQLGAVVKPFELAFGGNVPIGSGMSSSAALECSSALAINELFHLELEKSALILAIQRAEHNYVGTLCGIMDMFTSIRGKEDSVIRLDCRSLEYEYFPLRLGDYKLLLLNTNVSHSLASSGYNTRRQECEDGVKMLQRKHPQITLLRDVEPEWLKAARNSLPENVFKRCDYVLEENQRVLDACTALENGDFTRLGNLMYQSHAGLQHKYEVSCPELDFLVDLSRDKGYVQGARMMGGGFGGCTINLIETERIDEFVDLAGKSYKEKFGIEMTPYVVSVGKGAYVE